MTIVQSRKGKVELYIHSNEYSNKLFTMADGGLWGPSSEKPWYEPDDPEPRIRAIRIIAVVVVVAILLALLGMPTDDPLAYAFVVAAFSFAGLVRGLLNRELVREWKSRHCVIPNWQWFIVTTNFSFS